MIRMGGGVDQAVARVNGEEVPLWLLVREGRLLTERLRGQAIRDALAGTREELLESARENAIEHVLLLQKARALFPKLSEREISRRAEKNARNASEPPSPPWNSPAWLTREAADQILLEKLYARLTAGIPPPGPKEIEEEFLARPPVLAEAAILSILLVRAGTHRKDRMYTMLLNTRSRLARGEPAVGLAEMLRTQMGLEAMAKDELVVTDDGSATSRAAFSLATGEVSDVIEEGPDYVLFRLLGREPARALTLEESTPALREALWDARKNEEIGRRVDGWRAEARIELIARGPETPAAPLPENPPP